MEFPDSMYWQPIAYSLSLIIENEWKLFTFYSFITHMRDSM